MRAGSQTCSKPWGATLVRTRGRRLSLYDTPVLPLWGNWQHPSLPGSAGRGSCGGMSCGWSARSRPAAAFSGRHGSRPPHSSPGEPSKTYLKLGCLPGVKRSERPYLVVHRGSRALPAGGQKAGSTRRLGRGRHLWGRRFSEGSPVWRGVRRTGGPPDQSSITAGPILRHRFLCVDTVVPRV